MADFLTLQDLYNRVGARAINGYFDDQRNGVLTDDTTAVDEVLSAAEGEMYSRMMRSYPGDPSTIGGAVQTLVANDPALKTYVAWVACQLAAERRPAFTDDEGLGPYKGQWKRAIDYFESVSKGLRYSMGQPQAGAGRNAGGRLSPSPPAGTTKQFVFAPSKKSPTGHGGF